MFDLFFLDYFVTFNREGSHCFACNDRSAFLLQKDLKITMHGRVKMYVMC